MHCRVKGETVSVTLVHLVSLEAAQSSVEAVGGVVKFEPAEAEWW